MLADSNIMIYAARPEHAALRLFIAQNAPAVSIVTRIEVLGYHRLVEEDRLILEVLFRAAELLPLTDPVAQEAVRLRQQRRIGLGDSIIAATALVHELTLVTRNTEDFRWVPHLRLLDPLA